MTDDHPVGQRVEAVLFAEIGGQLHGLLVHRIEIAGIRQAVLTNLKGDVGVVGAPAAGAGASVPATVIPWQGLDGGN